MFDASLCTAAMVQSKLDKRLDSIECSIRELSRHLIAATNLTEGRLLEVGTSLTNVLTHLELFSSKQVDSASTRYYDIGRDDRMASCTKAEFCIQCHASFPAAFQGCDESNPPYSHMSAGGSGSVGDMSWASSTSPTTTGASKVMVQCSDGLPPGGALSTHHVADAESPEKPAPPLDGSSNLVSTGASEAPEDKRQLFAAVEEAGDAQVIKGSNRDLAPLASAQPLSVEKERELRSLKLKLAVQARKLKVVSERQAREVQAAKRTPPTATDMGIGAKHAALKIGATETLDGFSSTNRSQSLLLPVTSPEMTSALESVAVLEGALKSLEYDPETEDLASIMRVFDEVGEHIHAIQDILPGQAQRFKKLIGDAARAWSAALDTITSSDEEGPGVAVAPGLSKASRVTQIGPEAIAKQKK